MGEVTINSISYIKKTITIGPMPVDDSVHAIYYLNESSNPIEDSSGNDYDGTYNGSSFQQDGRIGYALGFDGNDDVVTTYPCDDLTGSFTLSAWIKFTVSTSFGGIIGMRSPFPSYKGMALEVHNNKLRYIQRDGTYNENLETSGTYNDGKWHLVTATFDGSTIRLYIDDEEKTNYPNAHTVDKADCGMVLGKSYPSVDNYYFNGVMDQPFIANKAMSLAEVKEHYNAGENCLSSNAYISKEGIEGSLFSDMQIGWPGKPETLNQDSFILKTTEEVINSSAYIKQTTRIITSVSYITMEGVSKTLNSDYFIMKVYTETLTSDTFILRKEEKSLPCDMVFFKPFKTKHIISYAYITKPSVFGYPSDSYIKKIENMPPVTGSVYTSYTGTGNQSFSVAVDNVVVIADTNGSSGLAVFDISDPSNPIKTYTDIFSAGGVDIENGYAFITNYTTKKLRIYDVSDPSNVSFITEISVGTMPVPIKVKDGFAYVQEYSGPNVYIVDITTPSSPVLRGTIVLPSKPPYGGGIQVIGDAVFALSESGARVNIYDVSDKDNPVHKKEYVVGGTTATGIAVDREHIYLSDYGNNRLLILENPCTSFSPVIVKSTWNQVGENTQTGGFTKPRNIAVEGDYVYFLRHTSPGAIQVYDVSDRSNPLLIKTTSVWNGPNSVAVKNRFIYTGLNQGALRTDYAFNIAGRSFVKKIETRTINSDSFIEVVENINLQSDCFITRKGITEILTSDSSVKLDFITETLEGDAHIKSTINQQLNSDSFITDTYETSIISNAHIEEVQVQQLISYGYITDTIQDSMFSKLYIKKGNNDNILDSDYFIHELQEKTLTSLSVVSRDGVTHTIVQDSHLKKTYEEQLNSDQFIKILDNEETFNSDYFIMLQNEETLSSDSYIVVNRSETLNSEMYILVETDTSLNSDSVICFINIPHPQYPLPGDKINFSDDQAFVTFTLPDNKFGQGIQVQLEIASDAAFNDILFSDSSWNQTNWQYFDGLLWMPWPSDGVDLAYTGNLGRLNIQNKLARPGNFYWRTRGILR